MDRKLACEIVEDLLPLYVDKMVSAVSKKSIEEHLRHCAGCNEIYRNMAYHLETEQMPSELPDVKRFLKRTKQMYFLYGLGILSFIAVLVCMIVDLSLNKGITWSLIAGSALVFADILAYVLFACKRRKGCTAMLVISIGTFCLLSAIQISRYFLMHTGTLWIFRYGFPIMLLWLGILWIPLLCRTILKWNIWDCMALLMVMVIMGNYATKLITGDYGWSDVRGVYNFTGNALGEAVGMIIFAIMGRIKKWKI